MKTEVKVTGGQRLGAYLLNMAQKLGRGAHVDVGFLEGATYPAKDGSLPVAQVAFWNEFGTINSPPRPFFRDMIAKQSPTWARKLGAAVKASGYNARQAMGLIGTNVKDELVKSIVDFTDPPNAPSTIARKGFDKPLIDTGVMQRAPDFVVKDDVQST